MSFVIEENILKVKSKDKFFSLHEFCSEKEEAFYLYDLDGIENRFNFLKKNLAKNKNPVRIHYAMKANSHPLVLQKLKSLGAHVDVVSLGEINQALDNNFESSDIIFSGVGKSRKEITEALKLGIYQLNVESLPELKRIAELSLIHI